MRQAHAAVPLTRRLGSADRHAKATVASAPDPVNAPLKAQLATMPVIEQAKGIIMAQSHCGNSQAFDLLRRASRGSNLPVRELAAQIVLKTAHVSPEPVRADPGITSGPRGAGR
jgi:hypothetical protein